MDSKQRLDDYIAGRTVDRRPNLTIVGSVVTQYTGITVERYCKDPKAMAESAVEAARDLRLDFVQIASDLVRSAEAFGTAVNYFPDKLPSVARPALDDISGVSSLKPLRVRDHRRLSDLVAAYQRAIELVDDIYPMTLAAGPVTIAANTRGVEDFLIDLIDAAEECGALLDIASETIIDLARELAGVGAKYVYLADPVASLVSPAQYESLVLPRHRRIYGELAALGITGRLHMCGNTQAILPYSSQCGAKIIDIDHAVNYAKALESVEGRCLLNGNIDPVADVYSADAAHVREAILATANSVGRARAMFMPGCELPTDTKRENILAISEALNEIGG